MELEKLVEVSNLFNFYSALLTPHQQSVIDLYYNQNLSMPEIADNLKISRQAVKDAHDKAVKSLYTYESKLKLFEKYNRQAKQINEIISQCRDENQKIKLNKFLEDM